MVLHLVGDMGNIYYMVQHSLGDLGYIVLGRLL